MEFNDLLFWKKELLVSLNLLFIRYSSSYNIILYFNNQFYLLKLSLQSPLTFSFNDCLSNCKFNKIDFSILKNMSNILIETENKINDCNYNQFSFTKNKQINVIYTSHHLSVILNESWKNWYNILKNNSNTILSSLSCIKGLNRIIGTKNRNINETLYSLLYHQITLYPDKDIILTYNNSTNSKLSLTYKQFGSMIQNISSFLCDRLNWLQLINKHSTVVIGLYMDRSSLYIACIYALLKLGGTFLPLSKSLPKTRLEKIIKQSQCICILTDENTSNFSFTDLYCEVISTQSIIFNNDSLDTYRMDSISQIPCIIYTSDSTGNPKGVTITQRALVNRCSWMWDSYPFSDNEILICKTSISFVDSLWEIFGGLLKSIPLVIIPDIISKDVIQLLNCIEQFKVTRLVAVPSLYKAILDIPQVNIKLSSLTICVSSGEVLYSTTAKQLKNILSNTCKLLNLYGSTEITADVTFLEITDSILNQNSPIPIGKPITNSSLLILDNDQNPIPNGFLGTLFVCGTCLSSGYWRDLLLSNKYFTTHSSGYDMYCTGDIVYVSNECIYFYGRYDDQVKIRGQRVEIGEIQNTLINIPFIDNAYVISTTILNSTKLVAFIVSVDKNEQKLYKILEKTLPDYMIPWKIIYMESLPLNSNGKIDRKELELYIINIDNSKNINLTQNNNSLENNIIQLLYESIEIKDHTINMNYSFKQLGGDSLSAVRFIGKIIQKYNIKLSVQQIFSFSSLNEIIDIINIKEKSNMLISYPKIEYNQNDFILSHTQKGMWFLENLHPLDTAYLIPIGIKIKGYIDIKCFIESIQLLLKRHSLLHSKYITDINGKPKILYSKIEDIDINTIISIKNITENNSNILISEFLLLPICIDKEYPMKILILNSKDNLVYIIFKIHHIISDGWSIEVLLKDLSVIYKNLKGLSTISLSPLSIQYNDYAHWQNKCLKSNIYKNLYNYWKNNLLDIEDTCGTIPFDNSLPNEYIKRTASNIITILPPSLSNKIKEFSNINNITIFCYMMSALVLLMYRCSSNLDITITTPTAMRNLFEFEDLIGMFVNTLPIRTKLNINMTILQLIQQVNNSLLNGLEHSDMPFDELVKLFYNSNRDSNTTPFSQIMIVQDEKPIESLLDFGSNIQIESLNLFENAASCDIALFIGETINGDINIRFRFSKEQYNLDSQQRIKDLYLNIINNMINNNSTSISIIPIIPKNIRQAIIKTNQTYQDIPNKSIFDIICDYAKKKGSALAIKHGNSSITFQELVQNAIKVANWIQKEINIKNDIPIIGVYCKRSISAIIIIIGIIAAGCAYTPLDPEFPQSRIDEIKKLSNMKGVIYNLDDINKNYMDTWDISCGNINEILKTKDIFQIDSITNLNKVCVVLFTSGTTNQPKGVKMTHKNIISLVYKANWIKVKSSDIISQLNTLSFDLGMCEIFTGLLNGAGLCIIEKAILLDPQQFEIYLEQQNVTIIIIPTSILHIIAQYNPKAFKSLSYVIFGGEKANTKHCNAILSSKPPKHLVNIYGPTEITFACTYYELSSIIPDKTHIPIGYPMSNSTIFIVDKQLQLVPNNIIGEIIVGGTKVANGYLIEKEKSKFINNIITELSGKYYRTGDLGKYDNNGVLYFMGRIDNQVKIRGFRVEPEEIVQQILLHPNISNSSVIVNESYKNNDKQIEKYLICFYIGNISKEELRKYLISKLPDYMIPRYYYKINKFPLTNRGKLDRKKLLELSNNKDCNKNIIWTEKEQKIRNIFEKLLGGIIDNKSVSFFSLGGNSLLAMRLLAQLREILYLDVSIQNIFKSSSIESLALLPLNKNTSILKLPNNNIIENELFSLSKSQLRIWIDQCFSPESPHYNVPLNLTFIGDLNINILKESIISIINMHPILRIQIHEPNINEDEPKQEYTSIDNFIDNVPLIINTISQDKLLYELENQHLQPFIVSKGNYLLRTILYKINEKNHVLSITFHHLISDGWSLLNFQEQLINEYDRLYNDKQQNKIKPNHYKNYILWESNYNNNNIKEHKEYLFWIKYIKQYEKLYIPFKSSKYKVSNPLSCIIIDKIIPKDIINTFSNYCSSKNCTQYVGLLSVLYILLYRYTFQSHITIGSIIANRPCIQMEDMIGFFVNNSISCLTLSDDMTFSDILKQLSDFILLSMEYKTLDFNVIMDEYIKCNPNNSIRMKDLLDIVFVLQEKQKQCYNINNLSIEPLFIDLPFTKFDFIIECIPLNNEDMRCILSYNSNVYPDCKDNMDRLLSHYINLLSNITTNTQQKISHINYLTKEENSSILKKQKAFLKLPNTSFSIPTIFDKIYTKYSSNIVGQDLNMSITFIELKEYIEQLGSILIEGNNIQLGNCIVVLLDKSLSLLISILSIIFIGAVFVPIESSLPKDRLYYITKSCNASLIITDINNTHLVDSFKIPIYLLNIKHLSGKNTNEFNNRKLKVKGDDICYILYTSGTTGKPKGVSITHNNVIKRFYEYPLIPLKERRRLQLSSIIFDPSIFDVFDSIFSGSLLVLIPLVYLDTKNLENIILEYKINAISLSTSYLHILITNQLSLFKHLKLLTFGGSIINPSLLQKVYDINPNCEIYNLYGPTETTFAVTKHLVNKFQSPIPIGILCNPDYYYIVDKNLQILPEGIPGELLIGGYTVSNWGYTTIDNSKVFIPDPFLEEKRILYKTGDIVYHKDDILYFCKRNDTQVKIQGNRVELEEIRSVSLLHKDISMSYVFVKENDLYMIYYGTIDKTEVVKYLTKQLPSYMIPIIIRSKEIFPLLPNLKLDVKKLRNIANSYILDSTINNKKESIDCKEDNNKWNKISLTNYLTNLWDKILGYHIKDDTQSFFQAGGTSLRLLKLCQILKQEFTTISIKMADLLIHISLNSQINFILSQLNKSKNIHLQNKKEKISKHNNNNKKENKEYNRNDIAIIGMDCYVPKAKNIDEFWNNLENGIDGITREKCKYPKVKAGGILEDVEMFDYRHFNIPIKQAILIDPQHRWLLECSSNALQNAGINPKQYQENNNSTIGIFTSLMSNSYHNINQDSLTTAQNFQKEVAGMLDSAATRVAYTLGLFGPAMAIQTACSSSLVGVHMACQSIILDDCSVAIVSGVSITFPQLESFQYQEGMILSPEGKCKSFDTNADGIVSGNGVGSIVLMRLEEAQKQGFYIHSIIKGSAVNNDGNEKASYHSGNIIQHEQVIKKTLSRAKLSSNQRVQYVEAHGAGTVLGDLIEVSAISQVYKSSKEYPLLLGSVKSNIGHLGPAAGILGLIKTILSIKHKRIPRTLHFKQLHPHLNDLSSFLKVPTETIDWKVSNNELRTGAIHSFGQGGTNVHIIVQEYKNSIISSNIETYQLFIFSASSIQALEDMIYNFLLYCKNQNKDFENIAYTLQLGRISYSYRKYFISNSFDNISNQLQSFLNISKDNRRNSISKLSQVNIRKVKIIFMFPGQGTEFNGMAIELYKSYSIFRNALNECEEILKNNYSISILDILIENSTNITINSLNTQLSIFVVSYGLCKLLIECNIKPDILIGHSFGEYVAGCISGLFSLNDALLLLINRGKLMNKTKLGKMIAVRIQYSSEIIELGNKFNVDIACHNSNSQIIFSGHKEDIQKFQYHLENELKLKVTLLNVSNGFHSRCMDNILPEFNNIVNTISFSNPNIPILSTVSGKLETNNIMSSNYWVSHIRKPVMFYNSLEQLFDIFKNEANVTPIIIQVGPGDWMSKVCKSELQSKYISSNIKHQCFKNAIFPEPIIVPKKSHCSLFLSCIGSFWKLGININWNILHSNKILTRKQLPIYPYQRILCSINNEKSRKSPKIIKVDNNTNNISNNDYVSRKEFNNLQNEVKLLRDTLQTTQLTLQSILSNQILSSNNNNNNNNISINTPIIKESSWKLALNPLVEPLRKQANHKSWGLSIALSQKQETQYMLFGSLKTSEKHINSLTDQDIKECKFPIGCLSTCFVLGIFEEMINSGKIQRYQSLYNLIPDTWNLSNDILNIQLHHLASHTSGLPCLPSNFNWNSNDNDLLSICNFNLEDLEKELVSCSLLFDPGSQASYSPLGIALLACILTFKEKNTFELPNISIAFQQVLTTKILRPQQLYNTTIIPTNEEIIKGYQINGKEANNWKCGSIFTSADGIYSSLYDLTHFLQTQYTHPYGIKHYMMYNEELSASWYVGLTPSSSCWLAFSPKKQYSVVLYFNTEMEISLELTKLGERCIRLLDNEKISINNVCSIISADILRIWKGKTTPPYIMNHLLDSEFNMRQSLELNNIDNTFLKIEDIEEIIEEIIIEILWGRRGSLDINRNWTFTELGIDSLQLLVVASEIERKLPNYELIVTSLFDYPTIHLLSKHIYNTMNNNNNNMNNNDINTIKLIDYKLDYSIPNFNSFYFSHCTTTASDILPIILQPNNINNKSLDYYINNILQDNIISLIENLVLDKGGVLLRGLPASSAEDFALLINKLFIKDLSRNYKDGISPRTSIVADKVFTSTEYPSQYNMNLHNEMSYSPNPPNIIMFFCHTQPENINEGSTPIAFSKDIYNRIDPSIRSIFEKKGILYITNLPSNIGGHRFGLSWQKTYNTDNPFIVEEFCNKNNIIFEWVDPKTGNIINHDSLLFKEKKAYFRTKRKCPAIRKDEKTNENIWFNHAHLFHPSDLSPEVRKGMQLLIKVEMFPKNCYFGDGSEIPENYLSHIRDIMKSCEVSYPWNKGDLVILNNKTVCHGRHAFKGNRKILVSMK